MPTIVTPALVSALFTGFRREYQAGYDAMLLESQWRRIAMEIPSGTASNTYGWLGEAAGFREWIGDRVINGMKAHGYQIVNKDWELTQGVRRTTIEDDQLGIYAPLMRRIGEEAARLPDVLLFDLIKAGGATLCFDGQFFFDTDHPVYPNHDGTGVAASVSNFTAGAAAPWYVLQTRGALRPFIVQMRQPPRFQNKTGQDASDHVFMTNEYLYGADARLNVGFGFWQMAHKSQAALNADSLFAAITAMRELKADGGKPLGVMPDTLLVPPALELQARKVLVAAQTDGGGSNVMQGVLPNLIVSARLA